MLYLVSTPIGNLEDITVRALKILKEIDFLAAEDTRRVQKLLNRYQIKTSVLSFHAKSSPQKLQRIIDLLKQGKKVALVSDSGTPGISDPGYLLIRRAIQEGIKLSPIPGASAFLAGLVVSGLPMDKFIYLGYLPHKKGRQTLFQNLKDEKKTVVFYESPHRLIKTLEQLEKFFEGERILVAGRELTKIYEEIIRGPIPQVLDYFRKKPIKGEFVLILGGKGVLI